MLAFLSYSQANFVAHDVASDNSNDDTIIDDTITNSETMLEPTVLDDPLFHSMSVIEGSEKEDKYLLLDIFCSLITIIRFRKEIQEEPMKNFGIILWNWNFYNFSISNLEPYYINQSNIILAFN